MSYRTEIGNADASTKTISLLTGGTVCGAVVENAVGSKHIQRVSLNTERASQIGANQTEGNITVGKAVRPISKRRVV